MALAPARLLLNPVRAVEPPHSSALSSASVCSAAGAYPHLSSFFFQYPPSHRSSFSVSASILEAQNNRVYKKSRHNQLRGHPDEAVSFDDVRNPYAEDPFRHPSRDLNGRARSAPRFGRVDVNGGRRAWEPNNYSPTQSSYSMRGKIKEGRYAEDPFGHPSRDLNARARSTPRFGRVDGNGGRRAWEPNNYSPRFSRVDGNGGCRAWESNNYPPTQGSYSMRGKIKEGRYAEDPFGHPGRDLNEGARSAPRFGRVDVNGGRRAWEPNNYSPTQSSYSMRGKIKEGRYAEDPFGHPSRDLNARARSTPRFGRVDGNGGCRAWESNNYPPTQGSYSMRTKLNEGRWQEGEVQQAEMVDSFKEANLESLGEPEQEDSSFSGSSPISRIMQRLRNVEDRIPQLHAREGLQSRSELADVLALPSAREYLSDRSSSTSSAEQSEKGVADTRFPWERKDVVDEEDVRARKLRPLSSAELKIPGPELRRLRILAVHLKQRVKLGKHGVTRDLVDSILQRFRTCEVVKVKCEGPPAGNMKKTLETLEEKTGGLIIWKAGSVAVLYRGQDNGQPVSEIVDDLLAKKYQSLLSSDGSQEASSWASQKHAANEVVFSKEGNMDSFDDMEDATEQFNSDASLDDASEHLVSDASLDDASGHLVSDASLGNDTKRAASSKKTRTSGPEFDKLEEYTMEVEDILKDLGPRYEDWTGPKPVPVDADLLPSSIPNYSPPYRLLPFGMRPNISNTTATHLRRLIRPLAPHFVIGRDRGLQGLAAAMVKLWEKSEIAKVGVKRGVLNTSHERIAEDLKQLTGGFFLCRDKYSMTFFRGKDFLPQTISAALANRQTRAEDLQVEEERGRADGSVNVIKGAGSSGSLPSWVHIIDPEEQIRLKKEAARAKRVQVIAHLERKVKMALQKKEKAGRDLDKVEQVLKPVGPSDDKEILTDEERFMLRKLGLKMKAYLLIGRRGVFSGVVQNMHLHWKHRELVKVVVKERDPVQLNETARMLEAESGGTLISVDPTSKGFAIVVYRGKNYTRPPELRPPNLLTKRLALRRSLEIQRRESLSRHMLGLEEEIAHLSAGLNKMKMLESTNESVLGKESNKAHDNLKHDGFHESQQSQVEIISPTGSQELTEDLVIERSTKQGLFEDDEVQSVPKLNRRKLNYMCEIGPIFKAVRLSKTERHTCRNEVLQMGKAPHFLVGRSNPMSTIAKAIRLHFLDHAFVKIGVSYRPRGTSVQDVVEELEDLTGGTAYAQDDFRVILYRGWPSGEDMPLDGLYDVLSLEQFEILEDEEGDDEEETMMKNTLTQAVEKTCEDEESDEDDDVEDEEGDDEEETMMENTLTQAAEKTCEDEESDEGEDVENEGMPQWDSLSDEAENGSFPIEENGSSADSRSIKVDCGSFLAGISDGAGADEMGLDLDLDEDV